VTYTPLLSKHVLCTQTGAVRQWYHVGHPDINKQHVQLFFMTATSGSGNGNSSESADLYKAEKTSSFNLAYVLDTYCYMTYIHLVLFLVQLKM
jgi:hypothetical protein